MGVMVLVVLTSGCVEDDGNINQLLNYFFSYKNYNIEDTSYTNLSVNTPTKTFSAYGVSFKYPSNWIVNSDNQTGHNIISVFKGVSFGGAQFQVEEIPNDGMTEESIIKGMQNSIIPGWIKKSSYWIRIDNKTAYEDIFLVNDSHFSKLMRIAQITLVKNDKTYLILLQAPDEEFDKEKPYFALILNSLKFH